MEVYQIKNSLSFSVTEESNYILLSLKGYIDTYNSEKFFTEVKENVRFIKHIIVDLENVTYISSNGIGTFIRILKELENVNRKLCIIHISRKSYDIFSALGFTSFFIFKNDIEDFLISLKKK